MLQQAGHTQGCVDVLFRAAVRTEAALKGVLIHISCHWKFALQLKGLLSILFVFLLLRFSISDQSSLELLFFSSFPRMFSCLPTPSHSLLPLNNRCFILFFNTLFQLLVACLPVVYLLLKNTFMRCDFGRIREVRVLAAKKNLDRTRFVWWHHFTILPSFHVVVLSCYLETEGLFLLLLLLFLYIGCGAGGALYSGLDDKWNADLSSVYTQKGLLGLSVTVQ